MEWVSSSLEGTTSSLSHQMAMSVPALTAG